MLSGAALLDRIASQRPDCFPTRFGRLAACDGGLLEVSGLSVPIGTLARVEHRPGQTLGAEVIGSSPADLQRFRRAEIERWTRLARQASIELD